MNIITLNTLELTNFDKNSPSHLIFLKKLIKDKTITRRFQGFSGNVLHNFSNTIFGNGFFIQKDNTLIGYISIGKYNDQEKSIYLQAAISSDFRGQGFGKLTLEEVSDHIFKNYYEVEKIILKIANDNIQSLATANSCGFKWLEKDYYIKFNPYLREHQNNHFEL